MTTLFNIVFAVYLLALLAGAVSLFSKARGLKTANTLLLLTGALIQIVYILWRWREAGRAPFSNMFESLVLFAWAIAAVYLVIQRRTKVAPLGAATALIAVATLAYASTFESDIKPLMPALQSNWLSFHVFTCFLGYGGFAISFLAALGYLFSSRAASRTSPETLGAMETVELKTISFGFLFLTVGIITGAVWANSAWGTYWSWDPKETWSLITWFIYAIYLHCRYMRGWQGRRSAWVAVIGFASVIFTYVGVNFLLSGLHSYA